MTDLELLTEVVKIQGESINMLTAITNTLIDRTDALALAVGGSKDEGEVN